MPEELPKPEHLPLWMQTVNRRLEALELIHRKEIKLGIVALPVVEGGRPVLGRVGAQCKRTGAWVVEFFDGTIQLVPDATLKSLQERKP